MIIFIIICVSIFISIVCFGYKTKSECLGFYEIDKDTQQKKIKVTAWDILKSLLIPLVILMSGIFINNKIADNNKYLEDNRYQNEKLDSYIKEISKLIINQELNDSISTNKLSIIKALTLNTLNNLKGKKKAELFLFITEIGLTRRFQNLYFPNLNLEGAIFVNSDLSSVSFFNSNLRNATFNNCSIFDTDFRKANLENTKFVNSDVLVSSFYGLNLKNTVFKDCVIDNISISNLESINIEEMIDNNKSFSYELNDFFNF